MKTACPRCGANVTFIPSSQKCYCEYCGSEIEMSEFELGEFENTSMQHEYDECVCSSCGAGLIVDTNTTITRCIYCGSNQILKNRFTGIFKPDEIIPFQLDNQKFVQKYRSFVNKRILAPNAFRKNSFIHDIKGVYVPFYVYTFQTHTHARGQAMKKSDDHTYYKYFDTEFELEMRSPQDASKKLNDDIMTSLEPFHFDEIKEFNPAYLNGFSAENGDEQLESLEVKANARRIVEVTRRLTKRLSGYHMQGGFVHTKYKMLDRKYVLLPVWFFNTKYKDKQYAYALNGQTGKVVGRIPLSKPKFYSLMALLICLALFLTVIIVMGSDSDDDVGEIIGVIWAGVVLAYATIKAKYKNVKSMLENPLQIMNDVEISFKEYSKMKFDKLFGKEYSTKKIDSKDEKMTDDDKKLFPKEEHSEVSKLEDIT